jgi:DNA-binding PadR family transcriptional regulator
MKEKIKILEKLKLVKNGSGKLPLNNLEIIINFDGEINIIGGELISLLKEMKKDEIITSDKNGWYYSITEKGLDFLEKNSQE